MASEQPPLVQSSLFARARQQLEDEGGFNCAEPSCDDEDHDSEADTDDEGRMPGLARSPYIFHHRGHILYVYDEGAYLDITAIHNPAIQNLIVESGIEWDAFFAAYIAAHELLPDYESE